MGKSESKTTKHTNMFAGVYFSTGVMRIQRHFSHIVMDKAVKLWVSHANDVVDKTTITTWRFASDVNTGICVNDFCTTLLSLPRLNMLFIDWAYHGLCCSYKDIPNKYIYAYVYMYLYEFYRSMRYNALIDATVRLSTAIYAMCILGCELKRERVAKPFTTYS